jgi:hypothetical protein
LACRFSGFEVFLRTVSGLGAVKSALEGVLCWLRRLSTGVEGWRGSIRDGAWHVGAGGVMLARTCFSLKQNAFLIFVKIHLRMNGNPGLNPPKREEPLQM